MADPFVKDLQETKMLAIVLVYGALHVLLPARLYYAKCNGYCIMINWAGYKATYIKHKDLPDVDDIDL